MVNNMCAKHQHVSFVTEATVGPLPLKHSVGEDKKPQLDVGYTRKHAG